MRGEREWIGGEFVVGGADGEGFDDPEGGCAGLGGDFANERDADGITTLPYRTPRWREGVAEDGEEGCEEVALGFGEGIGGAADFFEGAEVGLGERAQPGGWLAVRFGIGVLVGEGLPTLQHLLQIAGEELGEVVGGVVFVVVGEHC
jgi:hypothetical protein